MRTWAYNEIKAPADVDTLRDEACPICSEVDSFNGDECQVCGYVAPPKPFRDPDVDLAKTLDLRKQVDEAQGDFGGTNISPVDAADTLPSQDDMVEMAYEQDQAPVNPDMVNEDGRVPVDVRALDADGPPVQKDVETGAEQFAIPTEEEPQVLEPGEVLEQEEDQPGDVDETSAIEDSQASALVCPVCGLTAPSAGAYTSGDGLNDATDDGMGLSAGLPCPNCGKGVLGPASQMVAMSVRYYTN